MIRLFSIFFKMDFNTLPTALDLFNAAYKNFNRYKKGCPKCKAKGFLKPFAGYDHNLVDYCNKSILEGHVEIRRLSCSSCQGTFGVLPDIFIPHKSYNIIFILKVLKAYYCRTGTVEALCRQFGISTSTFYAWKKRYLIHKSLYLGSLAKYFYKTDPHLNELCNICLTPFLHHFFNRFGFSFLQYSKTAEYGST